MISLFGSLTVEQTLSVDSLDSLATWQQPRLFRGVSSEAQLLGPNVALKVDPASKTVSAVGVEGAAGSVERMLADLIDSSVLVRAGLDFKCNGIKGEVYLLCT